MRVHRLSTSTPSDRSRSHSLANDHFDPTNNNTGPRYPVSLLERSR